MTQRNKFSASAIEDVSMMGIAAEQLACLTIASCSFVLTGANCGKRLVRITTVAGNKHSGDCAAGLTGILTSCQHLCLRCQHPREHGTGEFRFRSQVLSLLAKKQRKKKVVKTERSVVSHYQQGAPKVPSPICVRRTNPASESRRAGVESSPPLLNWYHSGRPSDRSPASSRSATDRPTSPICVLHCPPVSHPFSTRFKPGYLSTQQPNLLFPAPAA